MEKKETLTIARVKDPPPPITDPERQYGGPQSGLPPSFIVGSELAPYLIVGLDFGAHYCRVSAFGKGGPQSVSGQAFRALVEDALGVQTSDEQLVHSLKHCVAWNYVVKRAPEVLDATEVTARFLRGIKKHIEHSTERLLAKAVIAVPACFTYRQRDILVRASTAADIQVLALINEPTAAALDACYKNALNNGKYLVISSGAYTFEASVIHVQNRLLEVKAVRGAQSLSGLAVTMALAKGLENDFKGCDPAALHVAVERAKPSIDQKGSAVIDVSGKRISLRRERAEQILGGLSLAMFKLISSVLEEAHTYSNEVAGIILTGEATKLWLLVDMLKDRAQPTAFFNGNTAAGAATYAALLTRQIKDWVLWDALASPIMVAQGEHIRDIISAQSPLPINGHALLFPDAEGKTTATILQRATDLDDDVVKVAEVKIVEELQHTESGASVDLIVTATADGTLAFSARHKALDVNLTVAVTEPQSSRTLLDLTESSAAPGLKEEELHEPGLEVKREGHQWYIQSVIEGSPAAQANIGVYDQLMSVDGVVVVELGDFVPNHLAGTFGAKKTLLLMRNSNPAHLYTAEVACKIPWNRYTQEQLKEAIVNATLAGDTRELVQALLDYCFYLSEKVQPPLVEPAQQALDRAVVLAKSNLGKNDILRLRALCAAAELHIKQASSDFDGYERHIQEVSKLSQEIVELLSPSSNIPPGAAAKLVFDLSMKLHDTNDTPAIRQIVKELVDRSLTLIQQDRLPESTQRRIKILREEKEQAIAPVPPEEVPPQPEETTAEGESPPSPPSPPQTPPLCEPAERAPEENAKPSEVKERTAVPTCFPTIDDKEQARIDGWRKHLLQLISAENRRRPLVDFFEDFAREIQTGSLPDPEMIEEFPYQIALSYKALGDWWLEFEGRRQTPDGIALALKRQECRGYIAFCERSADAYEIAAAILRQLISASIYDGNKDLEAKYLAGLAPVLAGMRRKSEAQKASHRLRWLERRGARLIHTTITNVVHAFETAGLEREIEQYCINQHRDLRLVDPIASSSPKELAEAAEALHALARCYARQKDVPLCLDACTRLLKVAGNNKAMALRYRTELAEFLVRVDDPCADSAIVEAQELAIDLGLITHETAGAWREDLRRRASRQGR